jgi:tetratricopeptide (TPR) repeat protein
VAVAVAIARPELLGSLGLKSLSGDTPSAAVSAPPVAVARAAAQAPAPAAPAAPAAAAPATPAPATPTSVVTAPPTLLVVQGDEPRTAPETSRGSRRDRGSRAAAAKANAALTRGLDALAAGEYLRAVQELEASLKQSPLNHGALHALGEAEFQLGHHDRALASVRRAVGLAPKVAGYRVLLGDILIKLHRYREAVDVYAVASAIAPANESIRERFTRAKDKLASQ